MAIGSAIERGSLIQVFDEHGRTLFSKARGSGPEDGLQRRKRRDTRTASNRRGGAPPQSRRESATAGDLYRNEIYRYQDRAPPRAGLRSSRILELRIDS